MATERTTYTLQSGTMAGEVAKHEPKTEPLDFIAPRDGRFSGFEIRAGDRVSLRHVGLLDEWRVRIGKPDGKWLEIPLGTSGMFGDACVSKVREKLLALRAFCNDEPESFPDRVLRVAREAGYEPTGTTTRESGSVTVFFEHRTEGSIDPRGMTFGPYVRDEEIGSQLRCYAGPDNQPEAVRARKLPKGDVSRIPSPSGVTWVPLSSEVIVIFDPPSADPNTILVDRETARRFFASFAESPRDAMISAIIARQVAAGGVDTEGTRHEAERWCAMLAGCVCEGMRATTLMGSLKLRRNDMWGRENVMRGKPLSGRNKSPGPHEGATAWASATWEEL